MQQLRQVYTYARALACAMAICSAKNRLRTFHAFFSQANVLAADRMQTGGNRRASCRSHCLHRISDRQHYKTVQFEKFRQSRARQSRQEWFATHPEPQRDQLGARTEIWLTIRTGLEPSEGESTVDRSSSDLAEQALHCGWRQIHQQTFCDKQGFLVGAIGRAFGQCIAQINAAKISRHKIDRITQLAGSQATHFGRLGRGMIDFDAADSWISREQFHAKRVETGTQHDHLAASGCNRCMRQIAHHLLAQGVMQQDAGQGRPFQPAAHGAKPAMLKKTCQPWMRHGQQRSPQARRSLRHQVLVARIAVHQLQARGNRQRGTACDPGLHATCSCGSANKLRQWRYQLLVKRSSGSSRRFHCRNSANPG